MPELKAIGVTGVALLLCLANTGRLDGQQDRQGEIHGTRTFEAEPGGTLVLDLRDGGSITVEGWNRDEIEIVYRDDENDERDFEITFDTRGNGLEVEASYARGINRIPLQLEIRVPRRYDLRTRSAGGGITLTNLEGRFSGDTGGGSITLHQVAGEARLSSRGGDIEITDSELDGTVSTLGGDVLVQDVVGDVRATSAGGPVVYRNVRDGRNRVRSPANLCDAEITENTVLLTNLGGSIDLREAPEGACVRTAGGDIDIRNGRHFIHAGTGGGDIEIEIESGDVTARTGAGEIEVIVERAEGEGDIALSTGLGDVTLIVPPGFSARYDLTIGYTRNSRRDFSFISDLDLDEERTTSWDSSGGTPRRYIYGSGVSGDGDYRVEIRTTNGNITIRER